MSVNAATIQAKVLIFRENKPPLENTITSQNIATFILACNTMMNNRRVQDNSKKTCVVFITSEETIGREGSDELKKTFYKVKDLNFGEFQTCQAAKETQIPEQPNGNKHYWIPKVFYPKEDEIPAEALTNSIREELANPSPTHNSEEDSEEGVVNYTCQVAYKCNTRGKDDIEYYFLYPESELDFFDSIIGIERKGEIIYIHFSEGASIPKGLQRVNSKDKEKIYTILPETLETKRDEVAINLYKCEYYGYADKGDGKKREYIAASTLDEFLKLISKFSNDRDEVQLYLRPGSKIPKGYTFDEAKSCYVCRSTDSGNNKQNKKKRKSERVRNFLKKITDILLCCWRKPKK